MSTSIQICSKTNISAFDQLTVCFGSFVSSMSSLFLLVVSAEEHYCASDDTAIE